MQILETNQNRLVLRDRSLLMGLMLALGAVLWVVAVMGVAVWGVVVLAQQVPRPSYYGLRLFGLALAFAFGCFFAGLGWQTGGRVLAGTSCTFDREREAVTITRTNWGRVLRDEHSIYGVSHAVVETNDELGLYAIYLVLRSGQRILLGVCNRYERATAEAVVQEVRSFLRLV